MEQRITIRIAERQYVLKASNQESEERIRQAAASINKKLSAYTEKFPDKNMIDILSIVALNESISREKLQKQLDDFQKEVETLRKDTDIYLDNLVIDKK